MDSQKIKSSIDYYLLQGYAVICYLPESRIKSKGVVGLFVYELVT